jgi:hypothetical protein
MRGWCQDLKDRLRDLNSHLELLEKGSLEHSTGELIESLTPKRDRLKEEIDDSERALEACLNHFRVLGYVQQQRRQGLR